MGNKPRHAFSLLINVSGLPVKKTLNKIYYPGSYPLDGALHELGFSTGVNCFSAAQFGAHQIQRRKSFFNPGAQMQLAVAGYRLNKFYLHFGGKSRDILVKQTIHHG